MGKIWDKNLPKSEVIGCCGGVKNPMTMQNWQKMDAKQIKDVVVLLNKVCDWPYKNRPSVCPYFS